MRNIIVTLKKQIGYTFIELLTVISISSLLLGYMILPIYRLWSLEVQLESKAYQLFETLKLARNIARSQGTCTIVCPNDKHQWETGWHLLEKAQDGNNVLHRYPPLAFSQQLFWRGAKGNENIIQFNAQGMSFGYNGHFTLSYQKAYPIKTKWIITLSSTGRALLSKVT